MFLVYKVFSLEPLVLQCLHGGSLGLVSLSRFLVSFVCLSHRPPIVSRPDRSDVPGFGSQDYRPPSSPVSIFDKLYTTLQIIKSN